MSGGDAAVIIGVLAGALGSLGGFIWMIFQMTGVAREVSQINHAVNHQDPEEPVLIERIKGIERSVAALGDRLEKVEQGQSSAAEVATERDERDR